MYRQTMGWRRVASWLAVALMLLSISVPARAADTGGYPYATAPTCASGNCTPDPWRFFMRECTSFVAWKLNTANGFAFKNDLDGNGTLDFGDASNWGPAARAFGYLVDMTPKVGSVAWWTNPMHVAWVEAVNGDQVIVQDYNYVSPGNYGRRAITRTSVSGYIHFKDIVVTPPPAMKTVNTDYNRDGTPDIFAFNRQDGGSNSTSVHVLNGANPKQWLLQTGTALPQTGPETDFAVDDYNRDGIPDIFAIQRNDGGSNSTAVRILNGANPRQWLKQSGTILGQTDANTSFAVGDYNQDGVPDIYAFSRYDAGSGKTAVRIINGANFHDWLLQTPMAMGPTDSNTEFAVGRYNDDRVPDIFAIRRVDTGSNSTSVHIMNGASPSQWLLQRGTVLVPTTQDWDFRVADHNRDGNSDLYAFNRLDGGSNSTSVHIVNGDGFGSWLKQTGTALPKSSAAWSFS